MFGFTLKRREMAYRMSEISGVMDGGIEVGRRGIVIGTKVATAMGWRDVGGIAVRDMVLTFDAGMQEVTAVRRTMLMPTGQSADWPLTVPAGAIGNEEAMSLAPRQMIVIESDLAEAMHGDPFVAVPAAALDGVAGIAPVFPREGIELISLQFAHEQVVFGAAGALFHCTASGIVETAGEAGYITLALAEARDIVEAMTAPAMTPRAGAMTQAGRQTGAFAAA